MSQNRNRLLGLDPTTMAVLLVLSIVSGLLTYQGLKLAFDAGTATWLTYIVAAAMAFAITLIVYLFWRTAFKAIATYDRGLPISLGMLVTVAFLAFIIAISSWFNVAGLAGAAAIRHDLERQIADLETDVALRIETGLIVHQFGPRMSRAAAGYASDAVSECSSGGRTGSGGEGTMCFTLRAVAAHLDGLAADLPVRKAEAEATAKRARVVLTQLRTVVGSSAEPAVKAKEAARLVDNLRGVLTGVSGAETLALIRATVEDLPEETRKRPLSARTKAGRERQRQALNDLEAELKRFAARTAADLVKAAPAQADPLQALERVNASTAVLKHAGRFAPFWVAGISLDLMPLAILLFLFVQRSTLTKEEQSIRGLGEITVKEILETNAAKEALRAPGLDKKGVQKTIDAAFGKPMQIEDPGASKGEPKDVTPKDGPDA